MTEEEFYNHPEFKLIRKILKKEFKWVKDVRLDGNPNRYNTLIFLELVIDTFEFIEEFGLTPASYLKKGIPLEVGTLSIFTTAPYEHPTLYSITKEIQEIPMQIHNTPALPKEYKLDGKRFDINRYVYEPKLY